MKDFKLTPEQEKELAEISDKLYDFCEEHGLPLIMRISMARQEETEKSCSNWFEPKETHSPANRAMKLTQERDFLGLLAMLSGE